MDILMSLSGILKDIIKDVEDETTKKTFVIEHIKNVTKNSLTELSFPKGHDWLNVSEPLTESKLRGKVVVLDFFTYCCINCLHVIPHLRALEENFSIADGLVVIGVHSAKFENEKSSSNIAFALRRYNITHPVINDRSSIMWEEFNISCWPTIVIIGPEGQALFALIGEECKEELFLYVECALEHFKSELSSHSLPVDGCSGIVASSLLSFPSKIARFENTFAISDSGNHRVLVIDEGGDIQCKIGGISSGYEDGPLETAKFNSPQGLAFYNSSLIYVADTENHAIRLINLSKRVVETVAGTGVQGTDYVGGNPGKLQAISSPWDLCFVPAIYVKGPTSSNTFLNPRTSDSFKFSARSSDALPRPFPPPPPPPPPPTPSPSAAFSAHSRPTVSPKESLANRVGKRVISNNVLLIAMSGLHQIWAFFAEDALWWKAKHYRKGTCVAIAGNGKEENRNNSYPMMASFAQPSGLAYSPSHKCVYIADSESSSIRKLSLEDGSVSHVAGGDKNPRDLFRYGDTDGKGYAAELQHPLGLACCDKTNALYVCDTYNNKLKVIDPSTNECRSLHEATDLFNEPGGCCLGESGEILYVADTNNNSIALFNVKRGVPGKLNVGEKASEEKESKYGNCDTWQVETEINSKGGEIIMVVELEPEDVHGRWRLDAADCASVKSGELTGEMASPPRQEFRFTVLPSKRNVESMNVFFNLTFCRNDVCLFKKLLLQLNVKKSTAGKALARLDLRKTIS